MTREVAEVKTEERVVRTVLDTFTRADGVTYTLDHKSAGWEPAGAMMRYKERETWGVSFREASGTLNGRRFRTLNEARSLFNTWTKGTDA